MYVRSLLYSFFPRKFACILHFVIHFQFLIYNFLGRIIFLRRLWMGRTSTMLAAHCALSIASWATSMWSTTMISLGIIPTRTFQLVTQPWILPWPLVVSGPPAQQCGRRAGHSLHALWAASHVGHPACKVAHQPTVNPSPQAHSCISNIVPGGEIIYELVMLHC